MNEKNSKWIPDLLYAEDEETNLLTNGLPFVELTDEKVMPDRLFILSAKTVLEEGNEVQEFDMHQYFSKDFLEQNLEKSLFEEIILLYKKDD